MSRFQSNPSFAPTGMLARCNDFERSVCRAVFRDDYSESTKTLNVIDHIACRGREFDLLESPIYQEAVRSLSEFSRYHAGLIRGFAGERRAFRAVRHASDGYELLVNIELDYDGEHCECDQILLTPQRLYVIEVKSYSSSLAVGRDGVIRFNDGRSAYNLGERMSSKRYIVSKIAAEAIGRRLSEEDMRCILLNASDKGVMESDFDGAEVCGTGNVDLVIEGHASEARRFTDEELRAIGAAVKASHNPVDVTPDVDFEWVAGSLSAVLSLIERAARDTSEKDDPAENAAAFASGEGSRHPRWFAPALVGSVVSSLFLGFAGGYAFAKTPR